MEVMVIHEGNVKPHSELGVFNVDYVEKNPEGYIFFLTPTEFFQLTEMYVKMGTMITRKLEVKELPPEWDNRGILTGLAASFNIIAVETARKNGVANHYMMGSLTPNMLGKDMYVAFLSSKKDMQKRANEVLRQLKDWYSHQTSKPSDN
ncbi:MAG: hypothetical protein ABR886_01105 [Dehalococcoidales bacterium]|jgi:hypothetical protein